MQLPPIIPAKTAIKSLRDSGYKNCASAISEIIDNSIEAKSKNIKITFHDERYSSDVIYKELRKNSISKAKIKKKIDQMAASYILQGFLDNAKHT